MTAMGLRGGDTIMSSTPGLYVGPYAMWVGEWQRDPEPDELESFDGHTLWGSTGKAEIEFGSGEVAAVLYTPPTHKPRKKGPKRPVAYTEEPAGGVAALDLGDIDR